MKNTKYILLALVLSLGLTSCNNLSQNANNKEETSQTEVSEGNKENKDAKDTKDEKEDKEAKKDDKEASNKDDGMEDIDKEELKEELKNLEDSLFENKVQARACEILIEENPQLVENVRDELDLLLEESNTSVEASEDLIRQLKEYLGEE